MEDILRQLTNEWAPEALRLGEEMFFWWGVGNLVTGFVWLVITSISLRTLYRWHNLYLKYDNMCEQSNNYDESHRLRVLRDKYDTVRAAPLLATIAFGLLTFIYLGNIWNWIAVFNPRIAMAHEIFTKLVK